MRLLAEQPYYKVERVLTATEQKAVKQHRMLELYADCIRTKHRRFPIADVYDLSYRSMGDEGGFLFVHTNHGVYSYMVPYAPTVFLQAFYKSKQTTEDE